MQRLKRAIKRIAAIGVGAAMLGATITSAVALDLAEYPAPFIVDGVWDDSNAIVVGAKAASSDTLGAIDIATRMQFDAKKAVSTGGGTLTAVGGVTEDIPIGLGIANSTTFALDWELDDADISSFQDTSINFQGADYNVHDELVLQRYPTASPSIESSLTSNEDDYESNVFMEVSSGAIRYYYVFDEGIIPNNATSTDPLKIKFLGKTLKITDVDSNGDKFTAYVGNEYFMKVGDSVTIDGKKVTLENVGSGGSIVVDVDGTLETIPASTAETVNGIEIVNDETFYEDTKSERSAHLIIGEDAQGTYKDGDAFIGEDENEPDWVWIISGMHVDSAEATTITQDTTGISESGPVIGIKNDFTKDDAGDNPAGIGECYDLPNNYASICLDSLTVSDEDYLTLTIEYADGEDTSKSKFSGGKTSAKTIKISAPGNERFVIPANIANFVQNGTMNNNDVKTSKIWLQAGDNCEEVYMYYYDADKNPTMQYIGKYNSTSSDNILRLNYKDTKDNNVYLKLTNVTTGEWNITVDVQGDSDDELPSGVDDIDIIFECSSGWVSLGGTVNEEEADELTWKGSTYKQIGNKDEDHRTRYGIIIKDPKSNGASDKVVLEIPADQVQANVVVKGQATQVTGGAVTYVPAKIDANPMLDTEITDPTAHNLILVGGPRVNTLTADFIGTDWTLESGEALIKLMKNGDKVALIVAGTDAIDTRMACKVLANYEDYNLETTEQIVTGTISAPTIKTA